ncbi:MULTISPECIES: 50S ribosomal protein L31e [Acidianus]|uniref:Large ribosomal subunit protein eL31 n=1 Tax=Candidatus Acidianus copahuensis TaxID=1160895 RepID=A0A031LR86_9CREN|nr:MULTISPECIES: 50S ribosomal protein L31e [Acidianus]EZQ06904.1 50S ribosomal protein L31 [Candidatus Acidianus copahuensis]NON61400.1 50S ribosomal protein L31e [Acidianus sp. RZ1]
MKEKDNFEMVINLRKIATGKRTKRAPRALREIKEIISRHFGAEKVIIDPVLANAISTNGYDKVVSRVRVITSKIDEKTYLVKLAIKQE